MALAELLERLERRTDTPDTPCNPGKVSAKPAPIVACTLDTPDTPRNSDGNWEARNSNSKDKRIGNVVATFASDFGLRYALDTQTDADPNARNIWQKNHAELARLVRLCGERYSFTEAEHAEALAVALADPDAALTCFRAMA